MAQQVLVTLDLPGASEEQRDAFYDFLEKKNWYKLPNLTTAWEVNYHQPKVVRRVAEIAVRETLKEAKKHSTVPEYSAAFQMHEKEVFLDVSE